MRAKELLDSGEALLLDVRIPEEAKMEWLPAKETVHIPLSELRGRVGELPYDRLILTYCKVSMRGYEAQRVLNAAGFSKVSFIEGGILAWPFETEMPGL